MRLPRMTTRRWMIATAVVAVLLGGVLRAQALQRRTAYHAREKQSCLQRAQLAEKQYRWMQQEGGTWCGSRILLIEIKEEYEETPELWERAAYHAGLEAQYRRAARYPWLLAPAERPFVPDDRNHPPEWLRAKAEAYKSLESRWRHLAEGQRQPDQTAVFSRRAEEDARRRADYDRRAKQAEVGSQSKVRRRGAPEV
jgi:hypothetical protein